MPGPFEDAGNQTATKPKVELKSQGKSMFDEKPKPPPKEVAKQQAAVVNERTQSYNVRAMENTTAFMKLLQDTTIPQNKSVFTNDIEREVIGKFQQLIVDMEMDEQQEAGMGSAGVVGFLMRVILFQRDRINQLDYHQHLLEKKIQELSALIATPKSK